MQHFEEKNMQISQAFNPIRAEKAAGKERIKLSWSNWGFGLEPLSLSLARLQKYQVPYIELHGNHYGPDLGYSLQVCWMITAFR